MANSESGDSVVDRVVRLIAAFPVGADSLQLSELARRAGLPGGAAAHHCASPGPATRRARSGGGTARQLGELHSVVSSRHARTYLAESYTGWPGEL